MLIALPTEFIGDAIMLELTPEQQQFIDAQVTSGFFQQPNEVVAAAFALLSERQREYAHLPSAMAQLERGEFAPLDIEEVKRRGRQRRGQQ